MLKLDIGGGRIPKSGHTNIDLLPTADVVLNLEDVGRGTVKLPFDDQSVAAVYSSHCFEHVDPYNGILLEIARVCILDAVVEIRTPHPGSDMASIAGHKHVLSEQQVKQWQEFKNDWWPSGKRMLELTDVIVVPTFAFRGAKKVFPDLTDDQIHLFMRNTAHENRFIFTVVPRS